MSNSRIYSSELSINEENDGDKNNNNINTIKKSISKINGSEYNTADITKKSSKIEKST